MPKRVLDFDALWASDKLAGCPEWAQPEYAWLYGLADASGSFEMSNPRVIRGRVAAIRPSFTLERLVAIFDEFIAHGLLFTWQQGGKRYGHWTGSDVPGRLPPPSWRARLERLAPPVPQAEHAAYLSRFRPATVGTGEVAPGAPAANCAESLTIQTGSREETARELKAILEVDQAQKWGLELKEKREEAPASSSSTAPRRPPADRDASGASADQLVRTFNDERGPLPPAQITPELRRRCAMRVACGLTVADFRQAVKYAAATPFLSGMGPRGWCVTFDWLLANDTNVRKILGGRYEPSGVRQPPPEATVGTAPVAAAFGARVSAATLERIRAREGIAPDGGFGRPRESGFAERLDGVAGESGEARQETSRKGAA